METQQISQSSLINQSLTSVFNYIHTGRPNEAIKMLEVVQRVEPENPLVAGLFQLIAAKSGFAEEPDLIVAFGKFWSGENLNGKSIEVFCDQGMGDLVQMLRYIELMKSRWSCQIVVNCYAYFNEFERLLRDVEYIDEFAACHKPCDYFTNFFSLPTILSGIELPVHYPAHFSLAMEKGVPPQSRLPAYATFSPSVDEKINIGKDKPQVGVAWMSNPKNQLSLLKSIPAKIVAELQSPLYDLWSLHPTECLSFMNKVDLIDLYDTTAAVDCLDYVVSVDTVVLHLAGTMQTTTFGLIPDDCDPRWGTGDLTEWYPSVTLIRQEGNWLYAVREVKECLESLCRAKKA